MARNHTTSKFQVGVIAAFVFLFLLLPAVSAARHTVRYENVRQFLPRRSMTALAIERILLLAENRTKVITVRKDGSGDFATVADAVNSIPAGVSRRTVIHIGPGLYREKVTVDHSKPFVTFYGDRHAMPRISFDGTAAQFGTFLSATVAVESHYFVACNIIFEVPKPQREEEFEILALLLFTLLENNRDDMLSNCGVSRIQLQSLLMAKRELKRLRCEYRGTKQRSTTANSTGIKTRFVTIEVGITSKTASLEGRLILSSAMGDPFIGALISNKMAQNCELHSVADGATAITAQARENISDKSGFSFVSCRISGTGDAFLSRAWKPRSRVVFAYTYMGSLVDPLGWSDKGLPERQRTVYYGEYKCTGPGSATKNRVSYGKILNDSQARPFLSKDFINGATWLLPPPRLRAF
uniref:pectinesterase n=1 Tax=Ananas comosus var. bracteatus TaxID=296719 RepID=A0A6V7P3S3_ANACO|nr:unnamed protein product [Ananas comosus var. bracteatus]